MSKLSVLLKSARAQAGLTQEALAKRAGNGLTAGDISRAERGELKPTTQQLKSIAVATNVTQTSLLDAARETSSAAKTTVKKAAAAKKTTSSTTAKKTAAKKTSTASGTSLRLTAAEKKLVLAWRGAADDVKKAALALLEGKETSTQDGGVLGGILSSGASGLGGLVGDLLDKLGK